MTTHAVADYHRSRVVDDEPEALPRLVLVVLLKGLPEVPVVDPDGLVDLVEEGDGVVLAAVEEAGGAGQFLGDGVEVRGQFFAVTPTRRKTMKIMIYVFNLTAV